MRDDSISFSYDENPAMFKNHPLGFILSILLIPAFDIGILILLYWYIQTKSVRLRIIGDDIELERGLLSKSRTDLDLRKIRTVQVDQGLLQRMFGVGTIEVYTTGDEPEFKLFGMPDPNDVRNYIKERGRGASDT